MSRGQKHGAHARARGFSHVVTTIEAAAIVGWFAVLVIGEKWLNDATTARRAAEATTEQSAAASAASYCDDTSVAAHDLPTATVAGSVGVASNGSLPVPNLVSLFATLGFGGQPTYSVYFDGFHATTAHASSGGVQTVLTVDRTTRSFEGVRALACPERSKDSPQPSIAGYRSTIFDLNIQGYPP